jgi:hypothetical protein
VKSMQTRIAGIIGIELRFRYNVRPENIDYNYNQETKAERNIPNFSVFNKGEVLSSVNDIVIYNIDVIGITGSWMHETPILPFFQHPDYLKVLERVKTFERDRTVVMTDYENQIKIGNSAIMKFPAYVERLKILKKPLINRLTILRNGELLAIIEVTTYGGQEYFGKDYNKELDDNISVVFRNDGLKAKSLVRLRNGLLYKPYTSIETTKYKYFKNDELAEAFLSGSSDRILMAMTQLYVTNTQNGGNIYYSQYMFLVTFIRLMVLEEGADSLDWSVNI